MPLRSGIIIPAVPYQPIINSAFNIWQDGASFPSIASGVWMADNWIYGKSGVGVQDALRSTTVPTVAQAQRTNYSLHLDVITADASIAAGDYYTLATRIEGYFFAPFDQKEWSFRFWVQGAKVGRHYVYARNSGADRSCVIGYDIAVADVYQEFQVTFPANPSAGTWDYTNGRGLEIGWCLAAGSTYHTTAGAWQTGNFKSASDQVNEMDSTANNFRIGLIGPPTLGSYAAPFAPVPIDLDEFRCKRYLEVWGGSANSVFATGWISTATSADFSLPMVLKRATSPTVSVATIGNTGIIGSFGVYAASGAPAFLTSGARDPFLRITSAGMGADIGKACGYYSGTTEQLKIASRIP